MNFIVIVKRSLDTAKRGLTIEQLKRATLTMKDMYRIYDIPHAVKDFVRPLETTKLEKVSDAQ
jgi:hypothetical protein